MANEFATQLWQARLQGTQVDVHAVELPQTVDEAYDVQAAITKLSNATSIGYKVGLTTAAAMAAFGMTDSMFGPIYEQFLYASGDAAPCTHPVLLETEVLVALGQDLPPRPEPYTAAEVAAATSWIAAGFELVACRLSEKLPELPHLAIADSGFNDGLVIGDRTDDWSVLDLFRTPVSLTINGAEKDRGHTGASLYGEPFAVAAWLANHPVLAATGLKAGAIVATGTCTGMVPVGPGDTAHGVIDGLGEVTVNFVAA